MYDALDPGATDRALQHRIQNPPPPRAPKVSVWGQAGELIASPFKGVGQAVQETTRVANTVAPVSVGNPLAMTPTEQEEILGDGGITREAIDQDLRRGIHALRPDPVTSTVASQVLQGAARVVAKAVGYGLVAGPAGAVVGTGLDEAATGTMELMDRGVDRATAAKAGAVRGAVMGASVAMPVVGQTVARTAGLVVAGGPGMFIAEQALTREILARAGHADIAAEYDPWDPVGLGLSVAIPGAVGVALHRARIGKGPKAGGPPTESRVLDDLAQDSDLVDAALVANRSQSVEGAAMGDVREPQIANSHARALDAAAQALDEGAAVHAVDVQVDPVRAAEIVGDMERRMRAALDDARAADEVSITEAAQVTAEPVAPRGQKLMPAVGGYNLENLLAQAEEALRGGRSVNQALADGGVTGELHNALVGFAEFRERLPELAEQFRAIEWNRNGKATVTDMLADAVGRMREGQPPEPVERSLGRAAQIAREYPDLPVRMDEAGDARPAAQMVSEARMQARRDKADGKAFSAAIECLLRFVA